MRIALIIIGLSALLAGVVVLMWPSPAPSAGQDGGSADAMTLSDNGQATAVIDSPATPAWSQASDPLPAPKSLLDFSDASGRQAGDVLIIASSNGGISATPVIRWQDFPHQGKVQVLVRSARGGLDGQRWFQATWRIQSDPVRVHFTDLQLRLHGQAAPSVPPLPQGGVLAQLDQGRWQVRSPDAEHTNGDLPAVLASAALDAARALAALQRWGGHAGEHPADTALDLAGVAHQISPPSQAGHAWLLAAQDHLRSGQSEMSDADPSSLPVVRSSPSSPAVHRYPAQSDSWADWRLWLSTGGHWQAAEHLHASPGTPDDPGLHVRRVRVWW